VSAWRKLRIGVLLAVLVIVALQALLWRHRLAAWDHTLWVAVYPIAGDDSPVTRGYIAALTGKGFDEIEEFMAREAGEHALPLAQPLRLELAPALAELPPEPPADRNLLGVVWWSLSLRRWASRMESSVAAPPGELRVFVVYHDPERSPRVPHSLALPQARIGVVHAFAATRQDGPNNVVVAHELLHAVGATDKYDPLTALPRHPDGYAEPDAEPLYPQALAEIMGGRVPLSPTRAEIPASLREVVIGAATAREIGWVREP
jgi:hypothetical protein